MTDITTKKKKKVSTAYVTSTTLQYFALQVNPIVYFNVVQLTSLLISEL